MTINLRNIIFGIAIFVLTIFVGIYGISTLYGEAPAYDKYCPNNLINQSLCESNGGVWVNNSQVVADVSGPKTIPVGGGYCQYDYTPCQKSWDDAQEKYYKKVFLTALPLGILVIFLGAAVFGLESVGAGLMLGGVGIMIYGTGIYWRFTNDLMKFLISLVGLVVLIWFAYWFNKKDKGFWKRFFMRR